MAVVVPDAAACMEVLQKKKPPFPNEPKVLGRVLCLSAKALALCDAFQ